MKKISILSSVLLLCLNFSCKNSSVKPGGGSIVSATPASSSRLITEATTTFANGSDVSWVTQMEASGLKYYNSAGTQQDLFTILKGLNIYHKL